MVFTNDLMPHSKYPKGHLNYKKILVEKGATIGVNVTIVCGNKLGKWCMVAAGAVVIRDVPSYVLVAGAPARRIGWVCECGKMLDEQMNCKVCGRKYEMKDEIVFQKNNVCGQTVRKPSIT